MAEYVGPEETKIKSIFKDVAPGYDRANDVISGGLHRLWRRQLVRLSGARSGDSVLDCATGTGDLAIAFKSVVGNGEVIGTDFCEEMLDFAPAKAHKAGQNISFSVADVLNLPFEDQRFDYSSIAFGIRNVSSPVQALKEMARVTKPGGKVMILETGQMDHPILRPFYRMYAYYLLPKLGGLVTGKSYAYDYLQRSSSEFPSREKFVEMMQETGSFGECGYSMKLGGVAYIYWGTVKAAH